MQQKSAVVQDLLTTYKLKPGNKSVLLFLHGWGDSADTFAPLLQELNTKATIVSLNLPGFGGSQHPSEPWSVSDYAAFTAQFLRKIGVEELQCVIGHSNGGAVAVRLLVSFPDLSKKAVLMASAGIRSTADQRLHRQAFKLLAKSGRIVTRPLGSRIQSRLKRQLYKKAGSDYLLLPHMQETFKKVVAEDVRESAKQLTQDVLLIWGKDDTATPLFMAEAYAELIPHSILTVIDDADHFVHQSHAQSVATAIQDFIS